MILMNSEFDSSKPIENYIDINSPLPEDFLEMVDLRISYLIESESKEHLYQELAYLAATGCVGEYWWHELRDHEIIENETEAERTIRLHQYSEHIRKFSTLNAYTTTNATKEGALEAGQFQLNAATAYDNLDHTPEKKEIVSIFEKKVIPNLKDYFKACQLDENIGNQRSKWWLLSRENNHEKTAEAYADEILNTIGISQDEEPNRYDTQKTMCKQYLVPVLKLHKGKEKDWQNQARDKMKILWLDIFNQRQEYTLPCNRT